MSIALCVLLGLGDVKLLDFVRIAEAFADGFRYL